MVLAVELGPKVVELTAQAADDLDALDAEAALPKQQEALRLLWGKSDKDKAETTVAVEEEPETDSSEESSEPQPLFG